MKNKPSQENQDDTKILGDINPRREHSSGQSPASSGDDRADDFAPSGQAGNPGASDHTPDLSGSRDVTEGVTGGTPSADHETSGPAPALPAATSATGRSSPEHHGAIHGAHLSTYGRFKPRGRIGNGAGPGRARTQPEEHRRRRSRAMPSWSSPASRAQENRRSHSAPSTPKRSDAISNRSRPYARRLFHQMSVPEVDEIDGLPPAVALQQQRGSPTTRSSVGSVTTLSNLLRMLYSRAGDYPPDQALLYAEAFSPNTPEGACPTCHGLGRVYDVTERIDGAGRHRSRIRERAIAAWPPAWHGQNLRDIVMTLGYDIDRPWRELAEKGSRLDAIHRGAADRAGLRRLQRQGSARALKRKEEPSYMGTFTGARRYVLQTFATTESALMKKRVVAVYGQQPSARSATANGCGANRCR